jgi:hypothetical protein
MRILVVAAFSLQLVSTVAHAQDVAAGTVSVSSSSDHDRWDAVRALPAGARLEIENRAGEFLEGRVRSVSGDGIAIDTNRATVDVLRFSVGRVILIGARQTGRRARKGFLIGAALGAAVTAIGRAPAAWTLFISSGWGGLGAAFGAVDGATTRERVVIYEAPP